MRLDNETARGILMVLLFAKSQGIDMARAREEVIDLADRQGEDLVRQELFGQPQGPPILGPIQEMIDALLVALNSRASFQDGQIVSAIVDAVSQPNARNILSGSTLQTLRNAVLTGEESRKLAGEISSKRTCAQCGHSFAQHELATVFLDRDPSGSYVNAFTCSNCRLPQLMACSVEKCEQHAEIPPRVKQILEGKERLCRTHAQEKGRQVAAAQAGERPPAAPEAPQVVVHPAGEVGVDVLEWARDLVPELEPPVIPDRDLRAAVQRLRVPFQPPPRRIR